LGPEVFDGGKRMLVGKKEKKAFGATPDNGEKPLTPKKGSGSKLEES